MRKQPRFLLSAQREWTIVAKRFLGADFLPQSFTFASFGGPIMLRFVLITVVAASLGSTQAVAQQADAWQKLRTFGHRQTEGTWHQKVPEDVTSRHTYKWAVGRQYLLVAMWHRDKPNALAITGVDPHTKLQTWWTFQDNGEIHIGAVDVETLTPNKDRVRLSGARAALTGPFEATWTDSDTLEIVPLPGAKRGEENAVKQVWKRSSEVNDLSWLDAAAPAELHDQLSLLTHLTGRKWIDGVMPDGTKFVGAAHGKWILDGKFHLYAGTTANEDQTTWSHVVITGIDPSTNEAASWEFTSSGSQNLNTYDKTGMKIYGKGTLQNGDKHSFEGEFTVAGETLQYRSKIAKEGEEPKSYGWNYRDVK